MSLLVSAAAAYFPARWLAQRAGFSSFRIFDVSQPGRVVQRAAVRFVSVMVPLLLVFLFATAALVVRGEPIATNRVEVLPGPAMSAGLQTGDRILSIDGVGTSTFEDIRRQVKGSKLSHDLVIERDGTKQAISVVPDENGAIKVSAGMDRRSIGPVTAMGEAALWIGRTVGGMVGAGSQREELRGPTAIVRSATTGQSSIFPEYSLWIACYVAFSIALLALALHVFDWLTCGWFNISSKFGNTQLLRGTLGRRRQALGLALLLGIVGLGVVTALEIADISLGTSMEVGPKVFLMLAVPLAWLILRELYGLRRALALTVLFFVPVLNVVLPVGLWFVAGRALRRASGQARNSL